MTRRWRQGLHREEVSFSPINQNQFSKRLSTGSLSGVRSVDVPPDPQHSYHPPADPPHLTAIFLLTIAPIFYAPAPHTAPLRPSSEALSCSARTSVSFPNAGHLPLPFTPGLSGCYGLSRSDNCSAAVKGLTREDTQSLPHKTPPSSSQIRTPSSI